PAAALASGGGPGPGAGDPDGHGAVLVDLTRCIGCRSCENACRVRRGHEPLKPSRMGFQPGEGGLTFTGWTYVDTPRPETGPHAGRPVPIKRQCMHCVDPACVSACPAAALVKTERGSVVWKAENCIGCRYCMLACPFLVPRFEWKSGMTPRIAKCDFCDDRTAKGLPPACVASCPTGALRHGKRRLVVGEAHQRRQAHPERYRTLYGDKVVGGTSWIYLSDVPLTDLGLPEELPGKALPALTWQALAEVPIVILGVGMALSGVLWMRRKAEPHG
ncbi:MAG: 4Fe-4S dicluster domain-containing protein, partial [Planctomycetes bacterium]|nr:4Fe-4S dicluster domain-containing protein [Planctomycetota bacterium]